MKIFAIAIFLLLQFTVAQDAPKNANVVIITTSDKPETAFRNIGRLFVNEQFELANSEPALLMITTKPQKISYGFLGAGKYYLKLQAQIDEQDSTVQIKLTGIFDDDMIVENHGMSGSPAKSSWEKMVEIAKKYKGGSLSYDIVSD